MTHAFPRDGKLVVGFLSTVLLFATSGLAVAGPAADLPEAVTFTEHIAPVFFDHCVSCHRPNDVAPMSLLTYDAARPWAKSIRSAVTEREMPPWDADRRYGDFTNDISLDDDEIELIRRWVDQGAVMGDLAMMPAQPTLPPTGSWKMGRQPDYVIDLAAIDVAADGPDLFITQVFGSDIADDKWIQALEILPGNTDVLHHVVTYLGPFGIGNEDEVFSNSGISQTIYLNQAARRQIGMAESPRIGGVWVAGSPPSEFRIGHGQSIAAKEIFSFNMHYHPSGVAGQDRSKLGLYFGKGEIQKEITTAFAADPGLFIPAGKADHREDALYLFGRDSRIVSLLPHMHNRGKSMRYVLERPDGSEEILLDVPKYDYNWQNIYRFREPVSAPAGSLVKVEASWDNSPENPANPDASVDVSWGDGTNAEMLVAFIDFVDAENVRPRPVQSTPMVMRLLERHAPEEAYLVAVEGMGFGGKWGLVVPDDATQSGEFYLFFGQLMFSTSLHGILRLGDELVFNTGLISSGGGSLLPLGFLVRKSADGRQITGEVFFGRQLSLANLDDLRGTGAALEGESLAAIASRAATSTGAGR